MYAKIFKSLFKGTLIGQTIPQHVFMYLLAHSNREGFVKEPMLTIATETGISPADVDAALKLLESPDLESTTPDEEGRRIVAIEGRRVLGWLIVNYEKYRKIQDVETVREQTRERVSRWRQRQAGEAAPEGGQKSDIPAPRRPSRVEQDPEGFAVFWDAYPRKIGRRAAAKAYEAALRRHPGVDPDDMSNAVGAFAGRVEAEGKEEQFTPHPTTWLNQDRFMEEFEDDETDQV